MHKELYLLISCNSMDAAAALSLDGLGLDADQQRELLEHLARSRSAAQVVSLPPPLVGPDATPVSSRTARPAPIEGGGDAPAQDIRPPEPEPPSRRGRGRPRGSSKRCGNSDRVAAHPAAQRARLAAGHDGSDSDAASGVDDGDVAAARDAVEEDIDDLYVYDFEVDDGLAFEWEKVHVSAVPEVGLRNGARPVSTFPPFTKGPTAPRNIQQACITLAPFALIASVSHHRLLECCCPKLPPIVLEVLTFVTRFHKVLSLHF